MEEYTEKAARLLNRLFTNLKNRGKTEIKQEVKMVIQKDIEHMKLSVRNEKKIILENALEILDKEYEKFTTINEEKAKKLISQEQVKEQEKKVRNNKTEEQEDNDNKDGIKFIPIYDGEFYKMPPERGEER